VEDVVGDTKSRNAGINKRMIEKDTRFNDMEKKLGI
jgi:hypothetical protein